jgi:ABC-type antimicrobial peptide transport system permease subunit
MIISSYLKTGARNFLANRLSSFINVLGLAATIGVCIVVYIIVDRQMNLDHFHEDHERIFTVQSMINWDGSEQRWARAPRMLGPTLMDEVAGIDDMVRVDRKGVVIKKGDVVFNETLMLADPSFFDLFDFRLKYGNTESLDNPANIIISENMAEKYFAEVSNPIGNTIQVISKGESHLLTVSGVLEKAPVTSSIRFNFLTSFENQISIFGSNSDSWTNLNQNSVFTYLLLDKPERIKEVKNGVTRYLQSINESNPDWPIERFDFEVLSSIAQKSQYTRECLACGSTPEILIVFAVIGLILLVSACFNYINISIASSGKRLKEIALRKVIGGSRKQIIYQFITENLVLCFVATVLGILIAAAFLVPGINNIMGGSNYEINLIENSRLLIFVVVLFITVGIISGAYPALYISSFQPTDIFRGSQKMGGKNILTKISLSFQFFLTLLAIVSGIIFARTNKSQQEMDWGYDQENIVVIPLENSSQYTSLKPVVEQNPSVVGYTGSRSLIGRSISEQAMEIGSEKFAVDAFSVGFNYLESMGLDLIWGRSFDENLATDIEQSVIVNEKFLNKIDIEIADLENQSLRISDRNYNIIGVVADFHHYDFYYPISPSIIRVVPEKEYRFMVLQVGNNQGSTVNDNIKAEWLSIYPDTPYRGFLQKEVFDQFFESTGTLIQIMNFTAIMAIILSSMGLFGLVSLLILKRMKELSIRNVLGASNTQIVKLISGQFIWLMLSSLLPAVFVSYFTFDIMLTQMFQGSTSEIGAVPFVLAFIILTGTILLTVSSHMWKLMKQNPVDSLRMD